MTKCIRCEESINREKSERNAGLCDECLTCLAQVIEMQADVFAPSEGLNHLAWAGRRWRDKNYLVNCPLCEYSLQKVGGIASTYICKFCPLKTKYGKGCMILGFHIGRHHEQRFVEAVRGL